MIQLVFVMGIVAFVAFCARLTWRNLDRADRMAGHLRAGNAAELAEDLTNPEVIPDLSGPILVFQFNGGATQRDGSLGFVTESALGVIPLASGAPTLQMFVRGSASFAVSTSRLGFRALREKYSGLTIRCSSPAFERVTAALTNAGLMEPPGST